MAEHFPEIFISYRRGDASGFANPLYDQLAKHFGPELVFRDVRNIEAGENFIDRFNEGVNHCKIFLPVIGTNWLTLAQKKKAAGEPDYVQLEITRALKRRHQTKQQLLILPILVEGASMPRQQDLVDDLRELADINAFPLVESWWQEGVAKLIAQIEKSLEEFDVSWERPAEEVVSPHRRAQEIFRYSVGFGFGCALGLVSFAIPLFKPVLSLLPDAGYKFVLLLFAALLGSLAVGVQWHALRKLPPLRLRRLLRTTLAVALGILITFTIVHTIVVVTLTVQGEPRWFIVGFSRRVVEGCPAEISNQQCLKNLSIDPVEIAKAWGENQIKLASLVLTFLYLGFMSILASLAGLLVAWRSK
ncbi:MAG TPA: toll/interleukin-1 receptor domain-containing protein [Pyrinomonadaceae bacterium]|nr:toll/interleukin-1 receptor domain-containing protein [Pyrinomonadaceae bacterium]